MIDCFINICRGDCTFINMTVNVRLAELLARCLRIFQMLLEWQHGVTMNRSYFKMRLLH